MAFYLTAATVQAMLGGGANRSLNASLNAGTAAVIEIYSGAVPANADAAEAGTLLVTLTCPNPALTSFTVSGDGYAGNFGAIASGTAVATGTASHFRIKTQTGGTVVAQGAVGTSGAELNLNTTAITTSSTVSITAAAITLLGG